MRGLCTRRQDVERMNTVVRVVPNIVKVHVKVAASSVRPERRRPPITLASYHLLPLTFTTMQTACVGLGSALRSAQRMRTSLDGS